MRSLLKMDERSVHLALSLQWEDLRSISSQKIDNKPIEEKSDFDMAVQLYKAELMSANAYHGDRAMLRSIGRAVMANGDAIASCLQEENQARQDREMAQRLNTEERGEDVGRPAAQQPVINRRQDLPVIQPRPPQNINRPGGTSHPRQPRASGQIPPATLVVNKQPSVKTGRGQTQGSTAQSIPTTNVPGKTLNPNKRPIGRTSDTVPATKTPKMYGSSSSFIPTNRPISAQAPRSDTASDQGKRPATNETVNGNSASKRQKVDHAGDTTTPTPRQSSNGELKVGNGAHPPRPIVSQEEAQSNQPSVAVGRKRPLSPDPNTSSECVACGDSFPASETAKCPCSHRYCRKCLTRLFEMSLKDESLFPPRCCKKAIPLEDHRNILSPKLAREFNAKEIEFKTPNRIYCHEPTCSAFIPPQFMKNDIGRCMQCGKKTCLLCKGKMHERECPKDTATLKVLQISRENGWQRCYSCSRVVELDLGCNHITCRCKAQFCYSCGVKWKNCKCDIWDEARLLRTANERVERDPNARVLQGEQRAQAVAAQVERLMYDDECEHAAYKYVRGEHECELCGDLLPWFIYECTECGLWVCGMCRFNRHD